MNPPDQQDEWLYNEHHGKTHLQEHHPPPRLDAVKNSLTRTDGNWTETRHNPLRYPQQMDDTITRSILVRSDQDRIKIHTSSIYTILGTTQLVYLNPITKAIQLMENATGDHELTNLYRKLIETSASLYNDLKSLIHMKEGRPTIRPKENSQDTRTTKLLKCLALAGIAVCLNKHHKTSEGMTPNRQAKTVEHFYPNISLQTWDRTKCHNAGTGWGPSPKCTIAEDDLKACADTLTASSHSDSPLSRKLADLCCSYLHPVVPFYDTYHTPGPRKTKHGYQTHRFTSVQMDPHTQTDH